MIALDALAPSYMAHGSRECCGVLYVKCPICGLHRTPIATCTGSHGGNESAGIKRWLLTGDLHDWSSISLSPSVDIKSGCHWHLTLTKGQFQ